MTKRTRDLLLITGIPGTGKTTYGNAFAHQFGFLHVNLEHNATLAQLASDADAFIDALVAKGTHTVITWGFLPDDHQIAIVSVLKSRGFKLIWFDGNGPAALKAFQRRNTVPEVLFYLQMLRIEESKVIDRIDPIVINPFHTRGFKGTSRLLKELREAP